MGIEINKRWMWIGWDEMDGRNPNIRYPVLRDLGS